MNQQAIEAGATALLKQGISTGELREASGDWGACGWTIKEEFRSYAQTVLTAARPHIEVELRAQIAEEVLDGLRDYECHEPKPESTNHPRACIWEIAQSAAQIVEGKP